MNWWDNYREYMLEYRVHPITIEREQAVADGMGERFMYWAKDGRQAVFKFNDQDYSVVYFPHQVEYGLTRWTWEVYSYELGDPIGRGETTQQLINFLAETFRHAYMKGVQ